MIRGRLDVVSGGAPMVVYDNDYRSPVRDLDRNSIEISHPNQVSVSLEQIKGDYVLEIVESGRSSESKSTGLSREVSSESVPYLRVACGHGEIKISVGIAAEIPLYFLTYCGEIYFSWRFEDLLRIAPVSLCRERASEYLNGTYRYGHRTLLSEVQLVPERSSVRYDGATTRAILPTDARSYIERSVRRGSNLAGALVALLQSVIQDRIPETHSAVLELSGGFDSSCVSIAASRALTDTLESYGLIFPGAAGQNQARRRAAVVGCGELVDHAMSIEGQPFLDHWFDFDVNIDPCAEIYAELNKRALLRFPSQGPTRVLTGIGGDEVVLPRVKESLAVSVAGQRYRANSHPKARLAESSLISANARAAMFLEVGLWPFNPYMDLRVVEFLERVPDELKGSRALQKEVLLQAGLTAGVIDRPLPENFESILRDELDRLSPIIRENSRPALVSLGLIDLEGWREVTESDWHGCSLQSLNVRMRRLNLEVFAKRISSEVR